MRQLIDKSKRQINQINTEYIILLVFLLFSIYFLIESYNYSQRANVFPRLTATVTLVGTLLLLFRDYLPGPLKRLSSESVDITEQFTSGSEAADEKVSETDNVEQADRSVSPTLSNGFVTGVLVLSFILFGHLIGLLWVTPVFIAVYTLWFRIKWYYTILLSLTGFTIAYTFNNLLILSLDEGILTEMVVVYG